MNTDVQVHIELGHRAEAVLGKKINEWTAFVRGSKGSDISHFVQKVVFYLAVDHYHCSKRVITKPPYEVTEYGPCNFNLKIKIYFENDKEPKKIKFMYNLFMPTDSTPVNHIRCEKLTFSNPTPHFREKILKVGQQAVGDQLRVKKSSPLIKINVKSSANTAKDQRNGTEKINASSTGTNTDMKTNNGKKRKSVETLQSVVPVSKKKKVDFNLSDAGSSSGTLTKRKISENGLQKEMKEVQNKINLLRNKKMEFEKNENISKLLDMGYTFEESQEAINKMDDFYSAVDYLIDKHNNEGEERQVWKRAPEAWQAKTGKPTAALGKPTAALGKPTAALGKPTVALEKPKAALGKPTAALGKPAEEQGKPTSALGKPAEAQQKPTSALGKPAEAPEKILTVNEKAFVNRFKPTASTLESQVAESGQTHKANESYNKMEEELTCPVCLELYNKPIILPCSHSLCKQCLDDVAQSRERKGQDGIECPSCRKVLNLTSRHISRLPENLALKNTIFHFEQVSLHHQEIQNARKKEETTNCCKDHHEEKVNMFCDQCKVLVCHLCVCDDQGQHIGHKVITKAAAASQIKEKIKLKRSTIEPLVNTVKERRTKIDKLCTGIENVHINACKQVEVEYFDVLKKIQNKKEALIQTLTQEKTQAVSNIRRHEEWTNSYLTNMEAMISSCQQILDENDIDEMLTKAGELPSLSDLDDKMQKSESEFSEMTRNCPMQKNITDAVDKFRTVLKECVKPLSTMGNVILAPSLEEKLPAQSLEEKQAYLDKLQELSKYIEPLRRMIDQHLSEKGEDNGKVMANMKQLLGILTDPNKQQFISMGKLLQLEQWLKKQEPGLMSSKNDNLKKS